MNLAVQAEILPPTHPDVVDYLTSAQTEMRKGPQVDVFTEHVLHAGTYVRTITMPPGTRLIGASIKRDTVVITVGDGLVNRDWEMVPIRGYLVHKGAAGRKQAFVSIGALILTMIFATEAKTVEEAEQEFTDEYEMLLSREQGE